MATLYNDVAKAIGMQVEQMIAQAQTDSEARVRHELSNAKSQLQQLDAVIGDLAKRVLTCSQRNDVGASDASQIVDRPFMTHVISELEQKWSSEVNALKQDLHRTILAHNHNSDLMRHHRDTLDEARRRLDASSQPKAKQVDAQIEKIESALRTGQAKQRALDALTERLTALEQQVDMLTIPYPGMMPPGMLGAGMPPGMEKETAAAARQKAKKEEVTDEAIRARLAGKGSGEASAFNVSAPVFVPGIASPGEELQETNAPMKLKVPTDLEESKEAETSQAESDSVEEDGAES